MQLAVDDFLSTLGEPTDAFAEQYAKGAKNASDLVLKVATDLHELAAGGKKRPGLVACRRLDMNAPAPTRTNDLRQADGIVTVRLGEASSSRLH